MDELKKLQEELKNIEKETKKKEIPIAIVYYAIVILLYLKYIGFDYISFKTTELAFLSIFRTIIQLIVVFTFAMSIQLFLQTIIFEGKNSKENKKVKEIIKKYKELIVKKSLENKFNNLKYYPKKGFTEEFIDEIEIEKLYDIYNSEDLITGEYKNVKFKQSDVEIIEIVKTHESDGSTDTKEETRFKGQILTFDFNKTISSEIAINTMTSKANEKVEFEDSSFNKEFIVYAKNAEEAFYVITPQFIEKLKKLKEITTYFKMIITNSKLYISLDNRLDSFEINPYKKIEFESKEKEINKEIKVITDIVDELNLDNDLYKK